MSAGVASAQGAVGPEQKISALAGGFGGVLDLGDSLGAAVAPLGDFDGDGVGDLAVGAPFDDDGGLEKGAVWLLFLNADGTVKSEQKISETSGNLGSVLAPGDLFGTSVCALGDVNGNGVVDLAVGAPGNDEGTVWILLLSITGTVVTKREITTGQNGFTGALDPSDLFGYSVVSPGDLDGNGRPELLVGATGDDDGGGEQGAVWVLFLTASGTVSSQAKISETVGGFTGILNPNDYLGSSLAALGDFDGDGIEDVAVGAERDDDGGLNQGGVYVLFLDTDGTIQSQQKISETMGGFGGVLDANDFLGDSLSCPGDLDGDGRVDLVAGASGDDDGGSSSGALWVLLLEADGTAKAEHKISAAEGGFGGALGVNDFFGIAVTSPGDLDGDGILDLAVGAYGDDDGASDQGAVWILFLDDTTPPELGCPTSILVVDRKGTLPGETVFYTVPVSDNVDPSPALVCVPPPGSFFPRGTTMVTCTAMDASGNVSMCSFPLTVLPTTRPRNL